jgi:hypothetical protein
MIRIQRLIYYFLILVFFAFISYTILPNLKAAPQSSITTSELVQTQSTTKPKKADPNEEKYLSWFPHR